ncbi:TonB-dependent receptor [Pontibacter lucknowensis]|uniref:Iron complex outermembrane recepter protein n=1 Tax=Pontibacter lucknowensis TaxID=1077936 RepID=A0A1N7A766_9BACT|nr:TonB-dependent receptor [Pontibacter lucknowensis]SIR34975.1 iron complex outermembrane recepter protein [Pontibacter lucknowensis]
MSARSMQGILSLLVLYLLSIPVFAQPTGSVGGKVKDGKGEALVGVSVGIKDASVGNVTALDGTFKIDGLPYGRYTLLVKGLGMVDKTVPFTLTEQSPHVWLDVVLDRQTHVMQEVLVTGRKETNYVNDYSFLGTKLQSRVVDVPQTISSVTKELIEDQQAFLVTDVVQNLAGVTQYSAYDDLTIRGFRNGYDTGYRLVNGLRSGYGFGTSFFRVPLTVNIESVEVLKGPGAALFGDINPGGTVNLVTKKPLDESRKAVSFSVGSFQTMRTTLDLTGPLNEDKSLLYRLNIGYEDTKTFRDVNDRSSLMIAPTVTFRPTANTTVNAELVYSQFDGYLDRGMGIRGGDLYALPRSFTLSQPSDYYRVNDISFNGSLNHRLTDWLSFNAAYMKFVYHEELSEHRTLNTFADAPANTIMNMRYLEKKINDYTDNLSVYFALSGNTGWLRHDVVAGMDYIKFEADKRGHQWEARRMEVDGQPVPLTFDLNNPTYELRDPSKYIRLPLSPFFVDYLNTSYSTTGLYLQDQITVTDRLRLLLGLRQEFFRDQRVYDNGEEKVHQNVLLPRAGLTYKLLDNLNYFASYSHGFKPIDPAFVRNPENYGSDAPFNSETSFQAESGLKGEFLNKRLFASLSAFHIEKRNTLVNTGQVTDTGNPIYRQNGRIKSQGVELEMNGSVSAAFNLSLNYAFNHTEIVTTEMESEKGTMTPNAPRHSAGLWAKYTFTGAGLEGFGLALGGNYVGERKMERQVQDTHTGDWVWGYWPEYAVLNAAAFYRANKFRLSLNVNNLFDEFYFVGGYDYQRAFPGAPRHFILSVGYTF